MMGEACVCTGSSDTVSSCVCQRCDAVVVLSLCPAPALTQPCVCSCVYAHARVCPRRLPDILCAGIWADNIPDFLGGARAWH